MSSGHAACAVGSLHGHEGHGPGASGLGVRGTASSRAFQAESAALPHAWRRTSESFDSEILEVQRSSHRHLPIGPVGSILDADIGFFYIAQTRRLPTTLCAMTIFRTLHLRLHHADRGQWNQLFVLPTRCVECERCEVWRQGPGCKFRQSTASAKFKLTY